MATDSTLCSVSHLARSKLLGSGGPQHGCWGPLNLIPLSACCQGIFQRMSSGREVLIVPSQGGLSPVSQLLHMSNAKFSFHIQLGEGRGGRGGGGGGEEEKEKGEEGEKIL